MSLILSYPSVEIFSVCEKLAIVRTVCESDYIMKTRGIKKVIENFIISLSSIYNNKIVENVRHYIMTQKSVPIARG
jgi:hypothetical protein